MINLYQVIADNNTYNTQKQVMSITTDKGDHRAYTYGTMFALVEQFAGRLSAAGIKRGDRIIIAAENSPEWNIAYLSIMASGCTAVLIDASLPKQELLHLIEHSDARCVYASPAVIEKLDCVVSNTIPVLNILAGAQAFANHLDHIAPTVQPTPDGDEEVAFIIYSSGTTRTATGIMHTHEAMLGTTNAAIAFNRLTCDEKMLVVIPNSHIYGVVTSMLGPLLLGASMHFIESMTAENVLRAFSEYRPTVFSCVPRVFEMFAKQITDKINSKKVTAMMFKLFFPLCLQLREKMGLNLGKVIFKSIHEGFGGQIRILCAAGAPMGSSAMRFYFGVGMNLFLNYGLTETNVPVIANSYDNYTMHSCGRAYPHVEIKFAATDETGSSELWLKSPFCMKGYFRDDAATAAAFEDGWFKTGDLGAIDAQGNISVVGRCKDNIVLSTGKKVTPDDIEAAYGILHGIKEFVVCGIPVLEAGYDEVHAFVVKDNASGTSCTALKKEIFQKGAALSQYMKISQVHFIDEIPKTSLQKPKRYLLKKLVAEQGTIAPAAEKTPPAEQGDVQAMLLELVRRVHNTDVALSPATRIFEDLGMDSLGSIELDLLIEETFAKSLVHCFKPQVTLGDLVAELNQAPVSTIDRFLSDKFPREKENLDYILFKLYSLLTHWVYKVEITGLENLPKNNGYIICPNHQTNFDFLWVTMKFTKDQFQKLGCMAKKELFNRSLGSRMISRVCGMIPVDRDHHNAQAIALCKQKLNEGWNFLIYPEGTRTRDGEIGEFKKGAAMLAVTENVPIVPVKIKGGFEIFPVGRKLPKLFDFKTMRRCRIQVAFAAPISNIDMDIDSLNQKLHEIVTSM